MVALNFPTSPADGDTYNGYVWDASITAWSRESEDGIQPVETSATAPSSPADGQLWFDTASETLFVYYEAGSEWVGMRGSTEISQTAPQGPSSGDMWWDSDNGNLYIYYDDGTSQQWVSANGPQVFVGTSSPAGYQGQLWFDSNSENVYIYYDDGTSAEWVAVQNIQPSDLPAGTVLQVVSTTKTDAFATNSTSFTDFTGLSATITPRSTSSKILVLVNSVYGTTNSGDGIAVNIVRGATNIAQSVSGSSENNTKMFYTGSGTVAADFSIQHLDSPATTSSLTYKIQVRNTGGANTIFFGQNFNAAFGAVSSITLIEVAG